MILFKKNDSHVFFFGQLCTDQSKTCYRTGYYITYFHFKVLIFPFLHCSQNKFATVFFQYYWGKLMLASYLYSSPCSIFWKLHLKHLHIVLSFSCLFWSILLGFFHLLGRSCSNSDETSSIRARAVTACLPTWQCGLLNDIIKYYE